LRENVPLTLPLMAMYYVLSHAMMKSFEIMKHADIHRPGLKHTCSVKLTYRFGFNCITCNPEEPHSKIGNSSFI